MFIKSSSRDDVIYNSIENKSNFVIVERSVAESKKPVNFESFCCNMTMPI